MSAFIGFKFKITDKMTAVDVSFGVEYFLEISSRKVEK